MISKYLFQQKLAQTCSDYPSTRFLLAVSGGADSMVLLELFYALELDFQVAHVNYKLRGEASELDQQLVENYSAMRGIKFHLYSVSEKDRQPEGSIQLWARDLRYNFFETILSDENLDFVVTAHHLNDNLETFLINLSRGSGIKGLCGIPKAHQNVIRPMLSFSKQEIYDFAKMEKIEFREDASNKKDDYLRNQIRNQIVPLLMNINPNFLENFSTSLHLLSEAKAFLDGQIENLEIELMHFENEELVIDKQKLKQQTAFVQYEILKKFGFTNAEEIAKIFVAETGKSFFSRVYQLLVDRNVLRLKTRTPELAQVEEIEILEENDFPLQSIRINLAEFIKLEEEAKDWDLDLGKLKLPIIARHAKPGDVFFPKGMVGSKKVSKLFKDEKLSIFAKQKIWLLVDGTQRVLGVYPLRQDRRFLANKDSKYTLSVSYQQEKKD